MTTNRRNYTLDDLIALNDELIALVRSGVPIERGLLAMRGDLSGRLQKLTDALAARIERGESLEQALASSELNLPPVYAATVRAGVRGGRLAAALEQLAGTARRIAQMRRTVGLAVMYPLLVVTVACFIFALVGPLWAQGLAKAHEVQRVPMSGLSTITLNIADSLAPFAYWLPAVMLLLILLWVWATGLARSAQPATSARLFRWLPGLGRMLRYSSAATFCEVLGLLVDHQVPLDEALPLAAATSGDDRLLAASETLADQIRGGQTASSSDPKLRRIPALVRWMLSGSGETGRSALAIRAAADDYHQRTLHLVEWMQIVVPILLVLVMGGAVVALFTFTVFGPWTEFVNNIARSIGRP